MSDQIKQAIKKSILAFLWDSEGRPYQLKRDVRAQTHGALLGDSFVSCLMGSAELTAGTEGLLFELPEYKYSEYVWIGDECWPAKNAKRTLVSATYVFATLVTLADGTQVLAEICEEKKFSKS